MLGGLDSLILRASTVLMDMSSALRSMTGTHSVQHVGYSVERVDLLALYGWAIYTCASCPLLTAHCAIGTDYLFQFSDACSHEWQCQFPEATRHACWVAVHLAVPVVAFATQMQGRARIGAGMRLTSSCAVWFQSELQVTVLKHAELPEAQHVARTVGKVSCGQVSCGTQVCALIRLLVMYPYVPSSFMP